MENKKFIIAMLVNNKHGVLTRIAGLFAKRAYNIDNLSVGKTDDPTISRMTIVTECDESIKDQIIKQLDKLIDVNNVQIMEDSSTVSRELMLIKIRIEDGIQTSVMEAINVFRAKVIDMSENSIIVEITGPTEKLNAFIQYMKKYGIMERPEQGLQPWKEARLSQPKECIMDIVEVVKAKTAFGNNTRYTLERSGRFSEMTGANIYLKCEHRQKTGSFKVRGAYNKIAILKARGNITNVIASSAGNHAQGVAFGARENGLKATIVMPRTTPIAKVLATQSYGAEVVLHGDCYDDAYQRAKEIEQETGVEFIEPFNDEDVIAGQGTIGLEIINELDDVDTIIIPTGGGGLIAGVAKAVKSLKPSVKIIGVQAHRADAWSSLLQERACDFKQHI